MKNIGVRIKLKISHSWKIAELSLLENAFDPDCGLYEAIWALHTDLPSNRLLKNRDLAARQRRIEHRKRSVPVVREHFEHRFKAVWRSKTVFQQPVKPLWAIYKHAIQILSRLSEQQLIQFIREPFGSADENGNTDIPWEEIKSELHNPTTWYPSDIGYGNIRFYLTEKGLLHLNNLRRHKPIRLKSLGG